MKTKPASKLCDRTFAAGKRVLPWLMFLCAVLIAQGGLVLTNYTSTNPLKVMPLGDSITDDCSFNGGWRAPLQPLLATNGFAFTFVGRQASSASSGFTQVRHEGYCGAVVAPPGVFAAHQYSAVNNYLQKIVPDALAITGNVPAVAMILIGANDIGRGRDPNQVATNDMATLLNLVLSNAPNANVILAKASSLQNGSAGGLNYGAYATNVPIYNAALENLVNQRRALGQNVFLADMYSAVDYNTMFLSDHVHPNTLGLQAMAREWLTRHCLADMYSAVDYNTMFLSDHVHPNTLGLQAMAREWLTRLQAITTRADLVATVLINGGASWKYNETGQDLGTNWTQIAYDDSGWSNGIARLGYGDPATATTVSYGPQVSNKFVTTYFRRALVVPSNAVITNLNLRAAQADGAVVWLHGREIYR